MASPAQATIVRSAPRDAAWLADEYSVVTATSKPDIAPILGRIDKIAASRARAKDEARTSPASVELVKAILYNLAEWGVERVPEPSVIPHQGGLQVIWKEGPRTVRLFCSDTMGYIYSGIKEAGRRAEGTTSRDVTSALLAKQLRWLEGR